MRTVLLAVACAALLVVVPPAQAQVLIGQGAKPSVAVDASGTAYIAWYSGDAIGFCRLPRGATACGGTGIATEGTSLSRPFVTVAGAVVRIVQYRYGYPSGAFGRVILFASADGGNSWDGGVSIGSASPTAFDEAAFGPGETLSAVSDNSGNFQRTSHSPPARPRRHRISSPATRMRAAWG